MEPLDIDDRGTWPAELMQWAIRRAQEVRATPEYTSDLPGYLLDTESELRQLLVSVKVLAYHCTCLLPHETTAIRRQGLRPLTPQLVSERVTAAVGAGAPDSAIMRARLGNVYAIGNTAHRENQVCLIVGRSAFDEDAHGCDPLLRYWGGEALRGGPDDVPELEVGTPSIVVAQLDCGPARDITMYPSMGKLLVGKLLKTSLVYSDVFYRQAVSSEDILAIWQPGNPEYDKHERLPKRRG